MVSLYKSMQFYPESSKTGNAQEMARNMIDVVVFLWQENK